ncbi:hypothetical protein SAMN04244570_1389 [Sporosarcina newyorkensis]|uniref:Uncharacterized protein n=1 Tax=Sporosarcina newyorkensis TaxID=759851 RepID=A0A1T4XXI1_9BACL|nr:hypothetical protein SAMN04244570_1389 [Sporosarcina newyorkensis]
MVRFERRLVRTRIGAGRAVFGSVQNKIGSVTTMFRSQLVVPPKDLYRMWIQVFSEVLFSIGG